MKPKNILNLFLYVQYFAKRRAKAILESGSGNKRRTRTQAHIEAINFIKRSHTTHIHPLAWITFLLLSISLACSLPAIDKSTPTPTNSPGPTTTIPATTTPLPPAFLESDPPPGANLPLTGAITLYFNQEMDRASVESAISGEPTLSGRFKWQNDSILSFTPDVPFLPDTSITLKIADSAQSQSGLTLQEPVDLVYKTPGYLSLSQKLPHPDSNDVDVSSVIMAAFNYPVVPLGEDAEDMPQAFTVDPPVQGNGEWINTSTYIFYPRPALAGGQTYTISLNPDLKGTDGNPLQTAESWTFTAAAPELLGIEPANGDQEVPLDAEISLTFNQPMDPESVGRDFSIMGDDGESIPGQSKWDQSFTTLTFTATELFKRDASYMVRLNPEAESAGGTPIGRTTQITWKTIPEMAVTASQPAQGGVTTVYNATVLYLSSIPQQGDLQEYISIQPKVIGLRVIVPEGEKEIHIFGDFTPETAYTLRISPELSDPWGSTLKEPYTLEFKTAPLEPNLSLTSFNNVMFLTQEDKSIPAQATNLSSVDLSLGSVPLVDFITMLGPSGYDFYRTYLPAETRTWRQPLDIPSNLSQPVEIPVTPDDRPLKPGLYMLNFTTPLPGMGLPPLLVVSDYHTTFKLSSSETLIWVVDMSQNRPAEGLPVALYDDEGSLLVSGTTDSDGIFQGQVPTPDESYLITYAVVGNPGDDYFSMAVSGWDHGITPNSFDLPASYAPPGLKTYIYTDRPIYLPGQTVYFRAVIRRAQDGRYTMPDMQSFPITIFDVTGRELVSFELPLSAFGTVRGQYTLLPDAQPGFYRLGNDRDAIWFQVAEYHKPEIHLQVSFAEDEISVGKSLSAIVEARYFFDAPASGIPVHWALYAAPADFLLPGYQVGSYKAGWLEHFLVEPGMDAFGELVLEGEENTNPEGNLRLELPTSESDVRREYTLEVTLQDESGLPVSARTSALINPADYFIGVRPEAWTAKARQELGFEILVVDWTGIPAGEHNLTAELQKVTWVREEPQEDLLTGYPTYTPEYTRVETKSISTKANGSQRLSFKPPEPGVYQMNISGEESGLTQVLVWVGGSGQVVWPNLPNQQVRLTADLESYLPGDTAQVFMPNPFNQEALALLTIERESILMHELLRLEPGGSTATVQLDEESTPNVYVSVTLLSRTPEGKPDFRQGYIELRVRPVDQVLNVSLTSQPERSAPGEPATFTLHVTDPTGEGVQGEFSLAVVDQAALELADPNAPGILESFYGEQPLGVRTSLSLAVHVGRRISFPGGLGGGSRGQEPTSLNREEFPDTAYWNADIVTNADGEARVRITLPDNLTTWKLDTRGVTMDTRVGEGQILMNTSKELLLRPVVPRFLVAGDHLQLGAVLHNNTESELRAQVTLQTDGVALDDPNEATQELSLPAGERARVEWWGTALDANNADLIFSVKGLEESSGAIYRDTARVASGALPVLHYTAPQTFATAGVMADADQRLELVSLPASYAQGMGELKLNLSASLAAAMLEPLQALEEYPYKSSEQTLSRFLPNLEAYRAIQSFGIESPELKARLERTLESGLEELLSRQNANGGWGWWPGGESDIYISAYILFGLSRSREAGASVPEDATQRAVDYLYTGLIAPTMASQNWQLDRLAFQHFSLAQAGAGDEAGVSALFEVRDRLSAWGQAFLSLALAFINPEDARLSVLVSDIQAKTIRSGSGAHWESQLPEWQNMVTPNTATAVVVYALSQLEPASTLLPDAVRYLMSHRQPDGGWASTYESTWAIIANNAYLLGTGELSGDFNFEATLNGSPIIKSEAAGDAKITPVKASIPVGELYPENPNALVIQRVSGPGRLYYSAALTVHSPAETAAPLDRGLSLSRGYYALDTSCTQANCLEVRSAQTGEHLKVRLTLVLPNDVYHLMVEDTIPAGSEILDPSLKPTQQGDHEESPQLYNPAQPYESGWGWWFFHTPQIYDEHIVWAADYLPAGTYELTYTLSMLQPGEYKSLPARAWQVYFPEVQGNSKGDAIIIQP